MKPLLLTLVSAIVLSTALANAAQNPTPFVNQPLVPASVAPGGPDFTLTVNGTGFVSGSTVNWNGSPRTTTFVSGSQLTATILSTDIATASTASVTVASPAPGGGVSNIVFMAVRNPTSFVSMNSESFGLQLVTDQIAVTDLDNDRKEDMAVELFQSNGSAYSLSILLGNGDGTFRQRAQYALSHYIYGIFSMDLNQDGNPDLIVPGLLDSNNQSGLGVLMGNGNGTFQPAVVYSGGACCGFVIADLNRDGAVDVLSVSGQSVCVSFGTGNGSFQAATCNNSLPGYFNFAALGDFNADGNLDMALTGYDNNFNSSLLAVALGNGDGTFQPAQVYPAARVIYGLTTADFNGDSKLDLAVVNGVNSTVSVYLGNGDGTFRNPSSFVTAYAPTYITTADMNGDGTIDLVVDDYGFNLASVSVLLGNGDGTFQNYLDYDASAQSYFALGDFNSDGRFDFAQTNGNLDTITVLTQDDGSAVSLSHNALRFSTQLVNTVSDPKLIILTNTGADPVKVSNITTTSHFSQLNNCKTIQPGKSCKIAVFFTPTAPGDLVGYMAITDDGGGSPQLVNLSGTATVVSFSPSRLDFGELQVGKVSQPQSVLLTNKGNLSLSINEVGIGGQNSKDFLQVNACPNKLPAGASCTISVYFHPTAQGSRSAILGVKDNGGGSPQKVPLTGMGT